MSFAITMFKRDEKGQPTKERISMQSERAVDVAGFFEKNLKQKKRKKVKAGK